jgi:hypothetical protein
VHELELIERFRANVESPDADRIAAARALLEAEYAERPSQRPRLRRPLLAGVPAAAVAGLLAVAVVALVAGNPGSHGPTTADAAIIRHAAAALTPPPNEILHTKVEGDGFVSETWKLTSAPYSFLGYKGPIGAATPEAAVSGTTASWYDPATNSIHESPITKPKPPQGFDDPLAQVHQALQNGEARVLGTAHVDGVNTYKIQFADEGEFGPSSLVAYVDQITYRPIVLDDPQRNGGIVHLRVVTIELLPSTPANMQLLSLTARHPGAHVIPDGSSASAGAARK